MRHRRYPHTPRSGWHRPHCFSRTLSKSEWTPVRTLADGLEVVWLDRTAAQRLRFLLDFEHATGLRACELVGSTLGLVEANARGDHRQRVARKGRKNGRVALPPLAWDALARYLAGRGLPALPVQCHRRER